MDAEKLKSKIAGYDVELDKGKALLADLDRRTKEAQATMLRIVGARQQCVEFLAEIEGPAPSTAIVEPAGGVPQA